MSVQDNVQQAKDAYTAFKRRTIPAVMQSMADHVEWAILGCLGRAVEYQRFEPYEFIAQGDKVVVLLHLEGTVRHNRRKFIGDDAHVLTYQDGKLVRFQSFLDTAANVAAYRGD